MWNQQRGGKKAKSKPYCVCPNTNCFNKNGKRTWVFESKAKREPTCSSCGSFWVITADDRKKGNQKGTTIPELARTAYSKLDGLDNQESIKAAKEAMEKQYPGIDKPLTQPTSGQRLANAAGRVKRAINIKEQQLDKIVKLQDDLAEAKEALVKATMEYDAAQAELASIEQGMSSVDDAAKAIASKVPSPDFDKFRTMSADPAEHTKVDEVEVEWKKAMEHVKEMMNAFADRITAGAAVQATVAPPTAPPPHPPQPQQQVGPPQQQHPAAVIAAGSGNRPADGSPDAGASMAVDAGQTDVQQAEAKRKAEDDKVKRDIRRKAIADEAKATAASVAAAAKVTA